MVILGSPAPQLLGGEEGEGEEFVATWTEFAQWLSTMPGAGTALLTRHLNDPRRYFSFRPGSPDEVGLPG